MAKKIKKDKKDSNTGALPQNEVIAVAMARVAPGAEALKHAEIIGFYQIGSL